MATWSAPQTTSTRQPKPGRLDQTFSNPLEPESWSTDDEIRSAAGPPGPYQKGALLGTGGWSSVYKIRRVSDGNVFAGKISKALRELKREAQILRNLRHNHILKFIDWYQGEGDNPTTNIMIMELCIEGSLQSRIDHTHPGMGCIEILRVIAQLAGALSYIHERGQFHTDVKPRNILIRALAPIDIVLADCADMQRINAVRKSNARGTPTHWSPEMVQHDQHHGPSDDVWAMGITLLGMMGQQPKMPWTKNELKEYPLRCSEHVEKLASLNPGHGIVELARIMLAREVKDRASAAKCQRVAEGLLSSSCATGVKGQQVESNHLGMKVPGDFQPTTFW